MKRFMLSLMAVLFVITAPTVAQAQWANLSTATVDNSGTPFWDNLSTDGELCNIGFVLNGQADPSRCKNYSPVGYLPLNSTVRNAIKQYKTTPGFDLFNAGAINVTVFGDINGGNRNWGWTQTLNTADLSKSLNTTLAANSVFTAAINPMSPWQLWVQLTNDTYAFSTGNQFAFFGENDEDGSRNGKVLYAGIEDIAVPDGDKDYNDMFLRLELQSGGDLSTVPEPSTYALMGAGLFGLGIVSRRRKQVA